MSKTIELPDDLYRDLSQVARERGISPADWIAAALPKRTDSLEERPLSELLHGFIGVVDSTEEPRIGHARTPFGERIAEKLERQGLRRS
jgi:hypothetical protein